MEFTGLCGQQLWVEQIKSLEMWVNREEHPRQPFNKPCLKTPHISDIWFKQFSKQAKLDRKVLMCSQHNVDSEIIFHCLLRKTSTNPPVLKKEIVRK